MKQKSIDEIEIRMIVVPECVRDERVRVIVLLNAHFKTIYKRVGGKKQLFHKFVWFHRFYIENFSSFFV